MVDQWTREKQTKEGNLLSALLNYRNKKDGKNKEKKKEKGVKCVQATLLVSGCHCAPVARKKSLGHAYSEQIVSNSYWSSGINFLFV